MSLLDVCLVSDDEVFRRYVIGGLKKSGFRIGESIFVADGLELAAMSQPHLLLLDADLTGVKGAVEKFQKAAPWAEIILVSVDYDHGDLELRALALRAGAAACPKSDPALLQWIQSAVHSEAPPTKRVHVGFSSL